VRVRLVNFDAKKRQYKRRFAMSDRAILMRVLGVLFDHERQDEGARLREWVAKVDALVDECGLLVHNIQQL
jgi:hypothetical protein